MDDSIPFADFVKQDTPRLVIMFQRGPDGSERFQWGIVGNIPVLSLIGYIARVQHDLLSDAYIPECPQPALVLAWDDSEHVMRSFVHPDISTDPLVGMLETIKDVLTASRLADARASKPSIVGPDGQPMGRF